MPYLQLEERKFSCIGIIVSHLSICVEMERLIEARLNGGQHHRDARLMPYNKSVRKCPNLSSSLNWPLPQHVHSSRTKLSTTLTERDGDGTCEHTDGDPAGLFMGFHHVTHTRIEEDFAPEIDPSPIRLLLIMQHWGLVGLGKSRHDPSLLFAQIAQERHYQCTRTIRHYRW